MFTRARREIFLHIHTFDLTNHAIYVYPDIVFCELRNLMQVLSSSEGQCNDTSPALQTSLTQFHSLSHSLHSPVSLASDFHPHADPLPFELTNSSLSIQSILDCRKIGQRFEYLAHWKDQPSSKDSWVYFLPNFISQS
ncbi:hypothetical protein DFH05DRAFT_108299 [Lentinula detonsa]|uniref:Chromo domain-containing protein n=1 Tax=Lentinula detonsa TaxID=2804962 RepID=A0A9W8U2V4_9AGAR|nr:hypothetical protein DFH05DRAFT_108299 [Lentinula detonsa]